MHEPSFMKSLWGSAGEFDIEFVNMTIVFSSGTRAKLIPGDGAPTSEHS